MTTWTSIGNAAVAVGGIPSSSTVTALRDNPAAMAEAAAGAPVIFAGWHPYNKVSVGDGVTGKFYDYAINGVQASVDTPDFEDGYEYRIIAHNMSHNSGSSQSLRLQYLDTVPQVQSDVSTTAAAAQGSTNFYMDAQIFMPRLATQQVAVLFLGNGVTNPVTSVEINGLKMLKARISFTGGSIDGGKIWLLRRREYLSGT